MSKTVVGLFKDMTEAQNIKHELVNQGYTASDIRVVADDRSSAAAGASTGDAHAQTGFGASISNFFRSLSGGAEDEHHYAEGVRKGGAVLSVTVPDGQESRTVDLLESYGGHDVSDRQAGMGSTANPSAASKMREVSENTSVPIVQEDMNVGKREVRRGGVRVYSHLVQTPVEEDIRLREEHVHVDRHKVDRPATEADFTAFQEGTIELTETAEEAVVSKKSRIVEEIVVGKESSERTETVHDTVRHTEIETENLGSNRPGSSSTQYDTDFRNHFKTNYANSGKAYESYAPAYQYGQSLADDPRYASGNWSSVEAGARNDWASKGSGNWEDYKGAVQQGWSNVRDSRSPRSAN